MQGETLSLDIKLGEGVGKAENPKKKMEGKTNTYHFAKEAAPDKRQTDLWPQKISMDLNPNGSHSLFQPVSSTQKQPRIEIHAKD